MISFVRGELAEVLEGSIVIEAGGIGYEIAVPVSVFDTLPSIGEELKIYTYFRTGEDAVNLYGFNTRADLEMFKQLLGVSGIGPKGALALLSALRPEDLRLAVVSGDAKLIATAPGIGTKTAQRIILELKDKISIEQTISDGIVSRTAAAGENSGQMQEAVEALISLGYGATQATRAVRGIDGVQQMDAGEIIKLALRSI